MKKISQHIQYKHPHIGAKERRILCAKAKTAKGKGALKPMSAAPRQKTLFSVVEDIPEIEAEESDLRRSDEAEEEVVEEESGIEGGNEDSEQGEAEEEGPFQGSVIRDSEEDTPDEVGDHAVIADDSEEGSDVVEIGGDFGPNHPFLVGLRDFLMSRHGKGRSEREAKQISAVVSQFLAFSGPVLDPKHLYNAKKLDSFLRSLELQGKKPTTQHAKLSRVKQGLMYVNLSLDPEESGKAEKCLTLMSNWMSAIGKEAKRLKRVNLEDMSTASMSDIERFAKCEKMTSLLKETVQKIEKGKEVDQVDLRQIMLWLAGSLMHSNAQRPGAVTNATLEEFKAGTKSTIGREEYKTFLVEKHKTSTTGRAKLTANRHLSRNLDLFVNHVRPALEGSESIFLFPNREGKQLDHLSRHVYKLANKLGYELPHTATATRHAAATSVAGRTEREREAVATAMSHSQRTQQLYYSINKGKKDALEGYRVMEGLRRQEKEKGGSRVPFTETETETISEYFSQHISSATVPNARECREFLAQHKLERDAKQIRDKIRNIIGRTSK